VEVVFQFDPCFCFVLDDKSSELTELPSVSVQIELHSTATSSVVTSLTSSCTTTTSSSSSAEESKATTSSTTDDQSAASEALQAAEAAADDEQKGEASPSERGEKLPLLVPSSNFTQASLRSPLSKDEEAFFQNLSPISKHRDRFDEFFKKLHSISRNGWAYVLREYLYMSISTDKTMCLLLTPNWSQWIFPLLQLRKNDRLMDKRSEKELNALILAVTSQVFYEQFTLDVAVLSLSSAFACLCSL
jgi:hypothetical protein